MNRSTVGIMEELMERYPSLSVCKESIERAFEILLECYKNGGKVLVCGNGGSAADSEHIVGELMKGFNKPRPLDESDIAVLEKANPGMGDKLAKGLQKGLPAISLVSHSALISAFLNDVDPEMIFAQQVYGYGREGDVLIGLTTSGNSKNILNAARVSKALKMKVLGMTGDSGGVLDKLSDVCIKVPENIVFKIQEYHLPIYHALCSMLESEFF